MNFESKTSAGNLRKKKDSDEPQKLQRDSLLRLRESLKCVSNYNYIVKIMAADDNTAFQIFETLDEKRQQLLKSNLIKNRVLNLINDKKLMELLLVLFKFRIKRREHLKAVKTLEYILPEKFENQWHKKSFFEEIKDYIKRLGNITLLKEAINFKVANEDFWTKKKERYNSSQQKIDTEIICRHDRWNAKMIKERENQLSEFAGNRWNLEEYY